MLQLGIRQEVLTGAEEVSGAVHLRTVESAVEHAKSGRLPYRFVELDIPPWWRTVCHRIGFLSIISGTGPIRFVYAGQDYPRPIVDHEVVMKENLAKMGAAYKKTPSTAGQLGSGQGSFSISFRSEYQVEIIDERIRSYLKTW